MDRETNVEWIPEAHTMPSNDTWFWMLTTLQVLSFISCLAARLQESNRTDTWCRPTFFAFLVVMAGATLAAMLHGCPSWTSSGATLSILCLAATFDPRGHMETAPF
jgi:hypothetical protein